MPGTVTIKLSKPINEVKILDNSCIDVKSIEGRTTNLPTNDEISSNQDLEIQKATYMQACQTLKGLSAKLSEFYDNIFAEHKEEIAKLSVEIARKILLQKVQNGDYEIESIVKETLKNAPTHQDMTVRLNPKDLEQCQKAQQEDPNSALSGIILIPDPNVGRAECVLENPKGIIKSLIDLHLEKITQALKEAK